MGHCSTHSQPFDHVLLFLAVCRRLENESPCQVSLVVPHEHVLVLHILQYHQLYMYIAHRETLYVTHIHKHTHTHTRHSLKTKGLHTCT